jgi:hypothetical protein
VTVSGQYFAPRMEYVVYWNTPDNPLVTVVTDDLGQMPETTFKVPETAPVDKHQVVVDLNGVVVARASFSVTAE